MPNVKLSPNVAVDLYALDDITPGAQIQVYNNDSTTVKLSTSEAGLSDDYVNVAAYKAFHNDTVNTGAWAICFSGGLINVKEV
ncbi:hypothetical protein VPHK165_0042 [Vibrio phage K165]|nr:hypothetical protein MYOV022v2_p0032 [Vibrio phage 12E28.1]QZI90201.1 hypothetical protein MYOV021v2_p0032 [Vibrio phage 18E29.1]QZI90566.1 hypothetical protein MYOV023v1_p0019 [Vibrio phage 91E28.1a]QZI90684.1 hypothetical protein MYOV020v1_p0058 [Vibrio phage 98E28.6a]